MGERVLVVEDDLDIQRMLERSLRQQGYEVATAADGATAVRLALDWHPDLMVLDVMLPRLDGLAVCREVRHHSDIPVVMLTARTALDDRIAGLETGADDYVVKPFEMPELLARLRAQLRRRHRAGTLRFGDIVLSLDDRTVRRGDRPVVLTTTEYLLLRALVERAGTVQTRSSLQRAVWGEDGDLNSNLLEVYVARLRKKLDAGGEPTVLHTVRGIGYVLRD